jgi:hypothetical protein
MPCRALGPNVSHPQLHAMHQQIQARAPAGPASIQWQRDPSVSHI